MTILNTINSPEDLRKLNKSELCTLVKEIRYKIIETTSKTGGHVASNLGVVELTTALHYVFNTPDDKIVWDVSHQCYTHKLLTGRKDFFDTLRQDNGCCGFTSKEESIYDCYGAGHAGTAISAALGMAVARDQKKTNEKIIAVVGDGSLTNGISLEGLNNIFETTKDFILILNDNKMSISENVGGITSYLNKIILKRGFNKTRNFFKKMILKIPRYGNNIRKFIGELEEATKSLLVPGVFFEELGIRYIGPIDGHNLKIVIQTLELIKEFDTPVVIHLITQKGKGFKPAELYPEKYHGLGKFDIEKGEYKSTDFTYTKAFSNSIVKLAEKNQDIVAITAAMKTGTGLLKFSEKFPDRFYDVGIAEEHAIVFAAGLASRGIRPIIAVYATFLQRALSSVFHDVCLQKLPVIICTDRSGIVDDGPTHHGIYDLSYLRALPNISILSPSNDIELDRMLNEAYNQKKPVIIRYPKGKVAQIKPQEFSPLIWGKAENVTEGSSLSIWTTGNELNTAIEVRKILIEISSELTINIINTRFLKPFDSDKLKNTASKMPIVSIEDNNVVGGLGSIIDEILITCKHNDILHFGWNNEVIPHGTAAGIRKKLEMTPENIAEKILDHFNLLKKKQQ